MRKSPKTGTGSVLRAVRKRQRENDRRAIKTHGKLGVGFLPAAARCKKTKRQKNDMTELYLGLTADLPAAEWLAAKLPEGLCGGCEDKRASASLLRSLGVRALLWRALSAHFPEEAMPSLLIGENGRPTLSGGGKHISLSHSDVWLAVALSDDPCGVDVEEADAVRHPAALAHRFLPPDEAWAISEADDPAMAFLRAFTRREAALKRGDGLRLCEVMKRPPCPAFGRELTAPDGRRSWLCGVGSDPFSVTFCSGLDAGGMPFAKAVRESTAGFANDP